MNLLVDTNALYWWLNEPSRLTRKAEAAITDKSNSVFISAIVPWELAIKTRLGKMKAERLLEMWDDKVGAERFSDLSIDSANSIRAGLLPLHHRDPFDRMLAAQAQATGWAIVSADEIFDLYGVQRIW
jgi:PIN domain nuclease of toxin-antitoxin system